MTRYALVRQVNASAAGLPIDMFAAAAGLHPLLVARLVTLGLLDARTDPAGTLILPAAQVPRAARILRLRTGLGLNYTALGLVMDLLERIEELETALRAHPYGHRR